MHFSRIFRSRLWAPLVLLAGLAPVLASAQQIEPGKYRHEEFNRVNRAAFNADGAGLVTTGTPDGRVSVVKRFKWSVEGGKLIQRNVAYTEDTRTWVPTPDTAIEIRNITPGSFELNRLDGGWTKWVRER